MVTAAVSLLVILFLFGPILLIVWLSFTPERGLRLDFTEPSLRWYRELLGSGEFLQSFATSLYLAVATTAIALVLGTLAAYALHRFTFRGREAVAALLLSPLMIPGVAIGLGLGQFLSRLGISYGFWALLIGHVVLTIPYVVRTVTASLAGVDRTIELAAQDLGASRLRAFVLVTVPLLRPGLVAGGLFTFITSFDELTVSLFLSSVRVVPLPVRLFDYLENVIDPTVAAISAVLVLLSLLSILALEWLVGLDRALGGRIDKSRL